MPEDPYADPLTGVLHNRLGLSAAGELEVAEREITHAALIFLKESPVTASYDLRHLCAIHRRIFRRRPQHRGNRRHHARRPGADAEDARRTHPASAEDSSGHPDGSGWWMQGSREPYGLSFSA